MNINDFNQWLDTLEKSPAEVPEDIKTEVLNRVAEHIHSEKDEEKMNKTSGQEVKSPGEKRKNRKQPSKKVKAAAFILGFMGIISISGISYASISGRLSGVHVLTPELEEQLDKPNPVQQGSYKPPVTSNEPPADQLTNTEILNKNSFSEPLFYNTVTDYALTEKDGSFSSEQEFVFDTNDVAVLTKENGEAWNLEEGDQITIRIALDTDFAGCELQGEAIEFAYVKDSKYIPFHLSKVTSTPQNITFQAEEAGTYYFAITNATVTYIKITVLEIN